MDFTLPMEGGGGGPTPVVTFTVGAARFVAEQGRTVPALLNFSWVGINQLTVTSIRFSDAAAKWLTLAETLPKTLTKPIGERDGSRAVEIRVMVPGDAQPGDYTVPVTVEAEAVGAQLTTNGWITFTVVKPAVPPSGIAQGIVTYVLAGLLLALVAYAYLKR